MYARHASTRGEGGSEVKTRCDTSIDQRLYRRWIYNASTLRYIDSSTEVVLVRTIAYTQRSPARMVPLVGIDVEERDEGAREGGRGFCKCNWAATLESASHPGQMRQPPPPPLTGPRASSTAITNCGNSTFDENEGFADPKQCVTKTNPRGDEHRAAGGALDEP